MKRKNRKRLNNKGFTLIELLAVVVILAIVMGITGTAVLNSINNSRKSTLYSAAQNAANNLNTWSSEDLLITSEGSKKLGKDFVERTQVTNPNEWICLSGLTIRNADGQTGTTTTTLLSSLGISLNDIGEGTTTPNGVDGDDNVVPGKTVSSIVVNGSEGNPAHCSAVRYNSSIGGYEVLLVAKNGGKYYVGSEGNNNYAFSNADGPGTMIG